MIDLTKYCANSYDFRVGLQRPWRDESWAYATNGHMIVRVPAVSSVALLRDPATQPESAAEMFRVFIDDIYGEFLPMPQLPADVACRFCVGGECFQCSGTKHELNYFALGHIGYNLHYLHVLSYLPKVRIRPQGENTPAALIFDGGQALLMPMRPNRIPT